VVFLFEKLGPLQIVSMPSVPVSPATAASQVETPVIAAPTLTPFEERWQPRSRLLAIRTNLLYDFLYLPGHYWAPSPNIQVEYFPKSGHFTANFGFTAPYWHNYSEHQFWQVRDYLFEGRFYFNLRQQFEGPYVSAYVQNNIFGIGFDKDKGWQGEGLGAGIMGGWTTPLSRNHRWRLELNLGIGYYQTRYDPYVYGNPYSMHKDGLYYYDYTGDVKLFEERNHLFRWIGPTSIGIHITYDLLFRRIQKRGAGFRQTERVRMQKGDAL